MPTRERIGLWLLALGLGFTPAACDDTKDEAPPVDSGNAFTDEDASSGFGSRADAGTSDDAGEQDGGTEPDAGESCEATKAEAETRDWAEGCFKCEPETSEQLLNSCATGWRTFDPANYPSSWQPGEVLPALP
jgi:hypothetical protein